VLVAQRANQTSGYSPPSRCSTPRASRNGDDAHAGSASSARCGTALRSSTGIGDWARHEVTAQIPPDANFIFFRVFLNGPGQIELRNPELEQD
jgi:hypothetical protein